MAEIHNYMYKMLRCAINGVCTLHQATAGPFKSLSGPRIIMVRPPFKIHYIIL